MRIRESHPVIPVATGIQSPDYAPARSWQQIFGGWTAASHPALSLQHNLYYYENSPFLSSCVAPAGHPVILVATGIQSPDYAPKRSWQQIFGGWTAASHPALSLRHNLHYYENSPFSSSCLAPAGHPVILVTTGIQSPDYEPTRSWQQIFGGWTAASHTALSLQHNLHYTQEGLRIPVAAKVTGDSKIIERP